MELFSIHCTTCNARLTVRSMRAIGQILACPKCQSMVQIAAPAGWTPPSATKKLAESPESAAAARSTKTNGSATREAAQTSDPAASPPNSTLLDSDFSESLAESCTTDGETLKELTPPLANKSPAEILGRRVAVAAGLIAGLAFTLFVLLRSDQDEPGAPHRPLAQIHSAAAEPEEPKDRPVATLSPPLEQPSDEPADATTSPADDSAADSNASPAALQQIIPQKLVDDAVVDRSNLPERPATPPLLKDVIQRPEAPLATEPEDAVDLSSEISAEDRAVAARLEQRIAAINFQRSKLSDLVEFLARMANVTLRFDPEALVAAHVETTARVSVQQTETTVAHVLDATLAKLGLTYEVRDAQVVIVTRPDPPARPQPAKGEKPAADDETPATEDSADPAADLRLDAVTP